MPVDTSTLEATAITSGGVSKTETPNGRTWSGTGGGIIADGPLSGPDGCRGRTPAKRSDHTLGHSLGAGRKVDDRRGASIASSAGVALDASVSAAILPSLPGVGVVTIPATSEVSTGSVLAAPRGN